MCIHLCLCSATLFLIIHLGMWILLLHFSFPNLLWYLHLHSLEPNKVPLKWYFATAMGISCFRKYLFIFVSVFCLIHCKSSWRDICRRGLKIIYLYICYKDEQKLFWTEIAVHKDLYVNSGIRREFHPFALSNNEASVFVYLLFSKISDADHCERQFIGTNQ